MQKCFFATIAAKMLCLVFFYFLRCVHFTGAKIHFCKVKCTQRKVKCYKCIWCCCVFCTAKNKGSAYILLMLNIFLWKMFSITFSKKKCSAKQNVTNAFDAALTFCWCWTFSKGKCSASNAFDAYILFCVAKMHLMRTFCNTKCYKCIWCVHFVTQNVTNAFDAKMHFGNATRTFSKGKCSAVQKCIFASNAFLLHIQHNFFLEAWRLCLNCSKNAYYAKIYFCKKGLFATMTCGHRL